MFGIGGIWQLVANARRVVQVLKKVAMHGPGCHKDVEKKPSGLESMPSLSTAYDAGGQPSISASRIIIRLALSAPASIGIDA